MTTTITENAQKAVRRIETNVDQIEGYLKVWEKALRLRRINQASIDIYKDFTSLQMNLATCDDKKIQEKFQKKCFVIMHNFICFIDCNLRTNDLNYLYRNETTKGFANFWDQIHDYCNNMIEKYVWARKY